VPYHHYVFVLRWLTVSLLAYAAVLFTVHVPWHRVAWHTLWPDFVPDRSAATVVVAVFGTTISPYLFFWQAAQEMEDLRAVSARNGGGSLLPHAEEVARRHLRRIRWDTYVGMGFSNLIAFFIILSTAATLHAAGIGDIQTSAQAAEALRPVGGQTTFFLFSLGIIGTGMLAVPVLAGSAAYAVSEGFDWQSGMDMKLHEALEFYGIIAIATAGGVALTFTHLDPMRALVWSAEINGVIAVPIMAIMMLLATREDIMGRFVIRPRLRGLGWSATAVMAVTVVAMIATT
jgi:Mn2+/Fe2+ NRAMP family transporter